MSAEGDLSSASRARSLGESLWTSRASARSFPQLQLPSEIGGSPLGEFNISFRAPEDEEFSIAALEDELLPLDAEDSPGLPPLGVTAQTEST